LIEYVRLFRQGDQTIEARKQLLIEQRKQLLKRIEDMKQTLERMDYKMARYNILGQKIPGIKGRRIR